MTEHQKLEKEHQRLEAERRKTKRLEEVIHEEEIVLGMMMQELQNREEERAAVPNTIYGSPLQANGNGAYHQSSRRTAVNEIALQVMRALKPLIMEVLHQHPVGARAYRPFDTSAFWRLDDLHTHQTAPSSVQYVFNIYLKQDSLPRKQWWVKAHAEHNLLKDEVELLQLGSGCEAEGADCEHFSYHGHHEPPKPAPRPRSRLYDQVEHNAIAQGLTTDECEKQNAFNPLNPADPLCRKKAADDGLREL